VDVAHLLKMVGDLLELRLLLLAGFSSALNPASLLLSALVSPPPPSLPLVVVVVVWLVGWFFGG